MKKKNRLPNKLSALIRVAVKDLIAVEKKPKVYKIHMGLWHVPATSGMYTGTRKCSVCLAGAVIAQTLKGSPKRDLVPRDYSDKTSAKLRALNHIRQGAYFYALNAMGISGTDKQRREILAFPAIYSLYANDKKEFKRELLVIADRFEAIGL